MSLSEADTCRRFITPSLVGAGWDPHDQIAEQRYFSDGRVIPVKSAGRRKKGNRADYILRYTRDVPIAVVEAKPYDEPEGSGLQQAMDYAQVLGLKFAYAANGRHIVEHDFLTGREVSLDAFPSPADLWARWKAAANVESAAERVAVEPYGPGHQARYYQTLAINRAVEAIAGGKERALLTLATGTGKSYIAYQICWRLWKAKWNRKGSPHNPKILYLADRNVLLSQPMLKEFQPFGQALHRIAGEAVKSREMYFATYQQIARDEMRPGLYREYSPDFFDLIVVDECHRGSASDDSNWREILDYFSGAAKLGMTATPRREESRDTYAYFGDPLVVYSLRQGIEDGFLAPYKVRRIVTDVDATGWRPGQGQKDRHGHEIPDDLYMTKDFERRLVVNDRTEAMARYLTRFLETTDPAGKTIVFCVDQEHALAMRNALARLNPDRVREHPDWVCRVTSDEGDIGNGHLEHFQDVDRATPVILTTSDMLTTGVDAPTVKNIVLCRVVESMVTFKQIIGRGTRLRTDYGKWYFTILDFTGAATRKFADPEFDGVPEAVSQQGLGDDPAAAAEVAAQDGEDVENPEVHDAQPPEFGDDAATPRKFYVDGINVVIAADVVYELDAGGKRLRTVEYTEYAGKAVRTLYRSAAELRGQWRDAKLRQSAIDALAERGIDLADLAERAGSTDKDPFDLLCHVAYGGPQRTRRERAQAVRSGSPDFWEQYAPEARAVLAAILDKYADHGVDELALPEALEVPPLSEMGSIVEIASRFGGTAALAEAVAELQRRLYAA